MDAYEVSRSKFQVEIADATAFTVKKNGDSIKDFWKKEQGKGRKTVLPCQLIEITEGEPIDNESKEESIIGKNEEETADAVHMSEGDKSDEKSIVHYDLREQVSITPKDTLSFSSSKHLASNRTLSIENNSDAYIAYKLKVSTHEVFLVQHAEGFVTPKSTADVNVKMRELDEVSEESLKHAKLAVDIDVVSISELTLSPKEFWKSRSSDENSVRFVLKCVNLENVEAIDDNDDNNDDHDVTSQVGMTSPSTGETDENRILHSVEKPPPSPKVGLIKLMRSSSLDGLLSPVEEENSLLSSTSTSPSKEGANRRVSFEGLGRHRDSMEVLPQYEESVGDKRVSFEGLGRHRDSMEILPQYEESAGANEDISTIDVSYMNANTDDMEDHSSLKRFGEKKSVYFQDDKKKSVHFDEPIEGSMSSPERIQPEKNVDVPTIPLRTFSEDSTFNPSSPNYRQGGTSPSRIPILVRNPLGVGTVASAQAAKEAAAAREHDRISMDEKDERHAFPPTPPSPRARSSPPKMPVHSNELESESTSQLDVELGDQALAAVIAKHSPVISDRMLDLLVKNVGTEEPLTGTEIYELKTARQRMSKSEWLDWLEIGRAEKHRRAIEKEARDTVHEFNSRSEVALDHSSSHEHSPYPEQKPLPIPVVQPIISNNEPLKTFSETNSSGYFINYKKDKEDNSHHTPGRISPPVTKFTGSLSMSESSPTPGQRFSMMSNFSKALDLKGKQMRESHGSGAVDEDVKNTLLLNQQRIDSACAAARTLLDAVESEDPQFIAANPGSKLNESKKSILTEMIHTLNRSRNELCDIVSVTGKESCDIDSMCTDIHRQRHREDVYLHESSLTPLYKIGTPRKHAHGLNFSSSSQPFHDGSVDTFAHLSSPTPSQHPHANNFGVRQPAPPSPSIRNSHILSESMNSGFSTSFDNVGYHNPGLYVSRDDFSVSKRYDLEERNGSNINYRGGQGVNPGNKLSKDTIIERLCVSERPIFKSDTFPIRVDVESAGVDVLWREPREGAPMRKERSVLRRERFQFDDVYAGLGAADKLFAVMRKRVRRAISLNRSLVYLGLSCGETVAECKSALEPPLALVFGDRGGVGALSVTVDELFNTLRPPPKQRMKSVPISAMHASYINITMTAVVLGGSRTIDLLGDFSVEKKSANKECRIAKRQDGKTVLVNATTVHLEQPTDLERIIGVLLGKKGCRREMMNMLCNVNEVSQVDNTFGASQLLDPVEATMLITIHVAPTTVGRLSPTDFQFVCPYGDSWSTASRDICFFAESLASFPYPPPPSVQNHSMLSRILLDRPASQPSDFLCVANVSKSNKDSTTVVSKVLPKFCSSINANSFRSLRQIPTVSVENHDAGSELIEKSLQVLRIISHMPNNF